MRILFDTLAYYSTLRKCGVPEDEALAMTRALEVALSQGVARREDLEALARRIETAFSSFASSPRAPSQPSPGSPHGPERAGLTGPPAKEKPEGGRRPVASVLY